MNPANNPRASDADVAARIALVRETTEAARNGVIAWKAHDRRLRELFCVPETIRAFDSSRPVLGKFGCLRV